MDRAEVSSICFNQQSTFVACCSDRGTVHIFSLESGAANNGASAGGAGGAAGGGAGGGARGRGTGMVDDVPRPGSAGAAGSSSAGAMNTMSG